MDDEYEIRDNEGRLIGTIEKKDDPPYEPIELGQVIISGVLLYGAAIVVAGFVPLDSRIIVWIIPTLAMIVLYYSAYKESSKWPTANRLLVIFLLLFQGSCAYWLGWFHP